MEEQKCTSCSSVSSSVHGVQASFDRIFKEYPQKLDELADEFRPVIKAELTLEERQMNRFSHGEMMVDIVNTLYEITRDLGIDHVPKFVREELLGRAVNLGYYYPVQILNSLRLFLLHHPEAQRRGYLPPPLRDQALFTRHHLPEHHQLTDRFYPEEQIDDDDQLRYFRDDYGLNAQHTNFHWVMFHRGFPKDPTFPRGERRLTLPEHQGEFQLYMHQQLVQRYRAERAALGLAPPVPFGEDLSEILPPYSPHPLLTTSTPDWPWPYLRRPCGVVTDRLAPLGKGVADLQRMWRNLRTVVALGGVPDDDGSGVVSMDACPSTPLTRHLLGCLIENSLPSQRWPSFFGYAAEGYHNSLHDVLSVLGQRRSGTTGFGVMGSLQDAMRDPLFFRIHEHIDGLRRAFVQTLTPFNLTDHAPVGVRLESLAIETPKLGMGVNLLRTRMLPSSDLYEYGKLDHDPFQWRIVLCCQGIQSPQQPIGDPRRVTVRLFLSATDRDSAENHESFLEMDKFVVRLPDVIDQDQTIVIVRPSAHSSIIVNEDPIRKTENSQSDAIDNLTLAHYRERTCRCGTPRNLILPRGTRTGSRFTIAAVLTAGDIDPQALCPGKTWEVTDLSTGGISLQARGPIEEVRFCPSMANGVVPDRLELGYPFSRPLSSTHGGWLIDTLERAPNAKVAEVLVFHSTQG